MDLPAEYSYEFVNKPKDKLMRERLADTSEWSACLVFIDGVVIKKTMSKHGLTQVLIVSWDLFARDAAMEYLMEIIEPISSLVDREITFKKDDRWIGYIYFHSNLIESEGA